MHTVCDNLCMLFCFKCGSLEDFVHVTKCYFGWGFVDSLCILYYLLSWVCSVIWRDYLLGSKDRMVHHWFFNGFVWVLFVRHQTQGPQIYIKLTRFEENYGWKLPLDYYLLRCCRFWEMSKTSHKNNFCLSEMKTILACTT